MSYQTKNQSIGYVMKALLLEGQNDRFFVKFYRGLDNTITEDYVGNTKIDNYSTIDYFTEVADVFSFNEKAKNKIISNLYFCFDSYTVEEAEEFQKAFKTILRI